MSDSGKSIGACMLACCLISRAGAAECPEQPLSPAALGHSTTPRPTLYDDFLTLVEALYSNGPPEGATKLLELPDHLSYQVPPWFKSSTDCSSDQLWDHEDGTEASFSDYLLDGDAFSELMVVTSLATSDERMLALHRTAQRLIAGSNHPNPNPKLPCYRARVITNPPSIECLPSRKDSATDITARVALAYYYAATNPAFPCASRAIYREAANSIAEAHLTEEYVNLAPQGQTCASSGNGLTSSVTGALLCDWIANGGGSAEAERMDELRMLIGYHQDVVRMLHAAYHATKDVKYLQRAEQVVDQWLIASTFTGAADSLSVGHTQFKWDTSTGTPFPVDDGSWGTPPWDVADAPRALWMGDALRTLLLTGAATSTALPPAYEVLRNWVERIQAADGQTATAACVQLNLDGTCFQRSCDPGETPPCYANASRGDNYYWVNGLGMGLHMQINTAELDDKLGAILDHPDQEKDPSLCFQWDERVKPKRWAAFHKCFGIYNGIRPLKALAYAIGLDAMAYSDGGCARSFFSVPPCRLLDTRVAGGALQSGQERSIVIAGKCGIPSTATSLALNITVTQGTAGGHLSIANDACRLDDASTLNFSAGQTRANNAVVRLSRDGKQHFLAKPTAPGGAVHLIVDVTGYFQ